MVIILNISFISLISSMFQWCLYKKSIKFVYSTNFKLKHHENRKIIKTTSISDTILVLSYIGYITQELNVAKTKYHVIYMREDDSTKTNYNFLNSLNILYQFLRQEDKEKPIKIPMRPETN